MSYIGDIRLGDTIDTKFCTVNTSGAPTTLAGSPVVSAYPGNSTTQLTAGITLSVDFDSVTGLHNVRVVASSGNGYATATNYQLVLTGGTVGGTSVVGYVVAEFSIEARSALMPTTAARTLDVSAGGEGGVDWANVGSPTTTLNLSGTTVKTATDVETDTQDIQSRLPAALVSGRMSADVVAISGDTTAADNAEAFFDGTGYAGTNNVIPTVTTLTNAPQNSAGVTTLLSRVGVPVDLGGGATLAGNTSDIFDQGTIIDGKVTLLPDAVWDEAIAGHLGAGSTGAALNAAGSSGDPWTTPLPGAYGSGTAGKIIGDNINATISSRMASYTQPTGFLAATFPATVASTTNITAGTITTATNLTNAPTAGDFTAVMKTSIGTAVAASAVASVTGNVGGNVTGSVGSVVGNVGGSVVGSVASVTGNVTGSVGSVVGAVGSVTGNIGGNLLGTLTSAERNAIADANLDRADAIETGLTPRQAHRLEVAAAAGKLSGAATTTATIRNAVADSKNRIVATVDVDGNRTAVTTDVS